MKKTAKKGVMTNIGDKINKAEQHFIRFRDANEDFKKALRDFSPTKIPKNPSMPAKEISKMDLKATPFDVKVSILHRIRRAYGWENAKSLMSEALKVSPDKFSELSDYDAAKCITYGNSKLARRGAPPILPGPEDDPGRCEDLWDDGQSEPKYGFSTSDAYYYHYGTEINAQSDDTDSYHVDD